MIGTKLAHYEITSHLGTGGMGEVYQATDSKLGRSVAIKLLPQTFSSDAERAARFEREARVLASLNHPNIAAIHGIEEFEGRKFLVMELVAGDTLADRIARGPMPVAEALGVARQIAEALEAAHEKGIIHRDLKPANIKLTLSDDVKVLDFGLAKVNEPQGGMTSLSNSPTIMSAPMPGTIMGTAAYMSPEQAKGKDVNRTADVWAFGCVLYEMLTGRAAFEGETIGEILGAVFRGEPDWNRLPADTPQIIRRLLRRCLQKDAKRRLQHAGDARIEIDEALSGTNINDDAAAVASRGWKWLWPAVAVLATLAAVTLAVLNFRAVTPKAAMPMRFTVALPEGQQLPIDSSPQNTVSPDGRYLAFVARDATGTNLWIRALDSLSAQKLDKTANATMPFWAPDSQSVAFFADGKLKRISLTGGSPQTLADAPAPAGGTWYQPSGGPGVIVFSPAAQRSGLQRVASTGGSSTPVTEVGAGELSHTFPQFLPDGQRFLYYVASTVEGQRGIYVQTMGKTPTDRRRILESSYRAVFAPPGFLLYVREGTLVAQKLDLDRLELQGDAVPIAENVNSGGNSGRAAFAVSDNGVLTYRSLLGVNQQLTSYARDGKRTPMSIEVGGGIVQLALSPDNLRLAIQRRVDRTAGNHLWLLEIPSGILSRLTFGDSNDVDQVWSPDSRRLIFDARGRDRNELHEITVGAGNETTVYSPSQNLDDWTPDGKLLVTHQAGTGVFTLPLSAEKDQRKPEKVFASSFVVDEVHVSPDGAWVTYDSNESGQFEVYVARFPGFIDRRQISSGGGVQPQWRGDGSELFYLTLDSKLVAVEVRRGENLQTGRPEVLFQTSIQNSGITHHYAPTRDGRRFFAVEAQSVGGVEPMYVIANWPSLLQQH